MSSAVASVSIEDYRRIFDALPNPVFVKDESHRYVVLNDQLCRLLGRPRSELIGRSDQDFLPPEQVEIFFQKDAEVFRTGITNENEEVLTDRNGNTRHLITRKCLIETSDGNKLLLGVIHDVTQHRRAQAQIRHLADHDSLTGFPNRVLFVRMIEQALARAATSGEALAVLLLDLDHFKEINDLFGHPAGDELLRQVSRRLAPIVRGQDTVARLGGDEFALLLRGVSSIEVAEQAAARVIKSLSAPFEAEAAQAAVGVSVGIACFPVDAIDAENLLRCADIALHRAKHQGRGRSCMFTPAMDQELRLRRQREIDLKAALAEDDQLHLHYQPQFDIASGALVGFEALLRWRHAAEGNISPADFIPLAEETGIIVPLGEWVLRRACRDAMHWPRGLRISVNVSAVQFRQPDFVETVAGILEETGLDAAFLELEITESVIMADTDGSLHTVERLRQLGVGIAMDDFGTGYSSLGNLRRFRFSKIKIDRSFIQGICHDAESAAIVDATLSMGRSLAMVTTAEGVETSAQLARLAEMGCDQAQGFLCGRPVPAETVLAVLANRRIDPTIDGWISFTAASAPTLAKRSEAHHRA